LLQQIDGRQYPSYHDLETPMAKGWVNSEGGFSLYVGRAQSDPFAPPTRCRVIVNSTVAQLPPSLYANRIRATATADFLLRTLYKNCRNMGADNAMGGKGWSGPKGGDVQVIGPCQHVLEQSAVTIDPRTGDVCAQVTINLPARGRTVLGQAAAQIFDQVLPNLVRQSLCFSSLDPNHLQQHVDSIEDQHWLQGQLESRGLIAFVRNGAILPRSSGVDDLPMDASTAIPFQSPEHLEVTFELPTTKTQIKGCGIPKGVTLICGGGFHGKSTLLQALQLGIYCKIPGDGREFCVTSPNAVKIRAEDGRCVTSVDISPFISNLPFGKDTTDFSTPDASGSTSQASNIVEVRPAKRFRGLVVLLPRKRKGEVIELKVMRYAIKWLEQCVWSPKSNFILDKKQYILSKKYCRCNQKSVKCLPARLAPLSQYGLVVGN
jgi:predicted ABC-class ATPase